MWASHYSFWWNVGIPLLIMVECGHPLKQRATRGILWTTVLRTTTVVFLWWEAVIEQRLPGGDVSPMNFNP